MNLMVINSNIPFWEQHGGSIIFFSIVIAIAVIYIVKKGIPSIKLKRETKKIEIIRKKQDISLNIKDKPVVDESREIGELSDLKMAESFLLMHMKPPDILDLKVPITHSSPVMKKGKRKLLKKAFNVFKRESNPITGAIRENDSQEIQYVQQDDIIEARRVNNGQLETVDGKVLSIGDYESKKAFILGSAVEYEALGKTEEAIEYYNKAKDLAEEMGNLDDMEIYKKKIKKLGDPWGAWRE